ncbi:MAG: hypothetical protein VB022_02490 [Rikenellaceae bacterium]|nr:hypothetical protein [Rikenellaceae bacterium]
MGNTQIKGRRVIVKYPAYALFELFSDLTNFTKNLPQDMLKGSEVTSTKDTLIAKVQGFEIGLVVAERIQYSFIRYDQYGKNIFPYTFFVHLDSKSEAETEFMIEMDTELSGMFKVMVGGKLQELVDKVTDQIEMAFLRNI